MRIVPRTHTSGSADLRSRIALIANLDPAEVVLRSSRFQVMSSGSYDPGNFGTVVGVDGFQILKSADDYGNVQLKVCGFVLGQVPSLSADLSMIVGETALVHVRLGGQDVILALHEDAVEEDTWNAHYMAIQEDFYLDVDSELTEPSFVFALGETAAACQ